MKKYHAVSAVIKGWFQNQRLRHKEAMGYTCRGILDPYKRGSLKAVQVSDSRGLKVGEQSILKRTINLEY